MKKEIEFGIRRYSLNTATAVYFVLFKAITSSNNSSNLLRSSRSIPSLTPPEGCDWAGLGLVYGSGTAHTAPPAFGRTSTDRSTASLLGASCGYICAWLSMTIYVIHRADMGPLRGGSWSPWPWGKPAYPTTSTGATLVSATTGLNATINARIRGEWSTSIWRSFLSLYQRATMSLVPYVIWRRRHWWWDGRGVVVQPRDSGERRVLWIPRWPAHRQS